MKKHHWLIIIITLLLYNIIVLHFLSKNRKLLAISETKIKHLQKNIYEVQSSIRDIEQLEIQEIINNNSRLSFKSGNKSFLYI